MSKKNKSSRRTSESRSLRAKLSVSTEPSAESERWSFFADEIVRGFDIGSIKSKEEIVTTTHHLPCLGFACWRRTVLSVWWYFLPFAGDLLDCLICTPFNVLIRCVYLLILLLVLLICFFVPWFGVLVRLCLSICTSPLSYPILHLHWLTCIKRADMNKPVINSWD